MNAVPVLMHARQVQISNGYAQEQADVTSVVLSLVACYHCQHQQFQDFSEAC